MSKSRVGRELVGQWDADLWSSAIKTSLSLNPSVHIAFVLRGDVPVSCFRCDCAAVDVCVIVYVHGWRPKLRLLPAQEFGLTVLLLGNTSVLVPLGGW